VRTLRERQVLPSSWISVSHVARPGLLDAAGIGGRRPSAENRLQTGRSPGGEHLVGTARLAFPEQLVEIKFVAKI
jgi:hypothetical protein